MMNKKFFSVLLALFLVLSFAPLSFADAPAAAKAKDVQRIDYDDGSYAIVTTEEIPSMARAKMQKSRKRIYEYYNGNTCEWSFTITGTFTYDGSTAKASNPGRYTTINNSSWSTSSTSAYASGASIKGSVTMKKGSTSKTANVTLTCKPDGTLI